MTTTLSERLKLARKNAKLTQGIIAEKVGIKQPTYQALESGKAEKSAYLTQIAKVLKVNPTWLATGEGEMSIKPSFDELKNKINQMTVSTSNVTKTDVLSALNPVPVISWVAAGSWSESDVVSWLDDDTEYLPRPANLSVQGFCLRVRGVSMMPEFRPDDVIYVEPNIGVWELKNGDLVVVREQDNQEATFKQLIIGDTSEDMYLKPLNPEWHEQKMIPKSDWELVGKVVGKWVRY